MVAYKVFNPGLFRTQSSRIAAAEFASNLEKGKLISISAIPYGIISTFVIVTVWYWE